MYIFINEKTIQPYNGEILKRYLGNKLIMLISNPTKEHLKEFGFMELVNSEYPEYDAETQFVETNYAIVDGVIVEGYIIKDIEPLSE